MRRPVSFPLRLERVNRWERIASRRRPAFSSHLINGIVVLTYTPASGQTITNAVLSTTHLRATLTSTGLSVYVPLKLFSTIGGNPYTLSVTNPGTSRTINLIDPGQTTELGLTLNGSTGLYQSKRGTAGCTTSGGATAFTGSCTTVITFPRSFADTNFSVVCFGRSTFTGVPLLQGATATAVNTATVQTLQETGVNASFATIDCIAVHD
jgi:hypothetical protein